eukprot:4017731-Pyramimonas_sp.AAC.1
MRVQAAHHLRQAPERALPGIQIRPPGGHARLSLRRDQVRPRRKPRAPSSYTPRPARGARVGERPGMQPDRVRHSHERRSRHMVRVRCFPVHLLRPAHAGDAMGGLVPNAASLQLLAQSPRPARRSNVRTDSLPRRPVLSLVHRESEDLRRPSQTQPSGARGPRSARDAPGQLRQLPGPGSRRRAAPVEHRHLARLRPRVPRAPVPALRRLLSVRGGAHHVPSTQTPAPGVSPHAGDRAR